ncbi:helix-turn-helix domain-containing protein [Candidatus Micrarchaeota archaeon]|nr:helix-turn-helix domain-containing protein [Candidatus Micrarchaeota archaeon]
MKSSIARELANRGFTQVEIADQLGLTQAAVSKYLSGTYSESIKELERNRTIRESIKKISGEIEHEHASRAKLAKGVCQTCEKFLGDKWDCRVSKYATDERLERVLETMLAKSVPADE